MKEIPETKYLHGDWMSRRNNWISDEQAAGLATM